MKDLPGASARYESPTQLGAREEPNISIEGVKGSKDMMVVKCDS